MQEELNFRNSGEMGHTHFLLQGWESAHEIDQEQNRNVHTQIGGDRMLSFSSCLSVELIGFRNTKFRIFRATLVEWMKLQVSHAVERSHCTKYYWDFSSTGNKTSSL